jgi:hypothetical protein
MPHSDVSTTTAAGGGGGGGGGVGRSRSSLLMSDDILVVELLHQLVADDSIEAAHSSFSTVPPSSVSSIKFTKDLTIRPMHAITQKPIDSYWSKANRRTQTHM